MDGFAQLVPIKAPSEDLNKAQSSPAAALVETEESKELESKEMKLQSLSQALPFG